MGLGVSHSEGVHSSEWGTHGALAFKAKNVLKSESGNLMAVNQPLHMTGKLRQKREVQFIKIA